LNYKAPVGNRSRLAAVAEDNVREEGGWNSPPAVAGDNARAVEGWNSAPAEVADNARAAGTSAAVGNPAAAADDDRAGCSPIV